MDHPNLYSEGERRITIWDKIVFKQFHERFGGRLDNFGVGSAPTNPKVLDFIRTVSGAYVRIHLVLFCKV